MVVYQYVRCCDCGGGGGTTRPLPRDGGAEELRGDPTVGKSRIEREEPKMDLAKGFRSRTIEEEMIEVL